MKKTIKIISNFFLFCLLFPLNSISTYGQVLDWVVSNPGMGVDVCMDQFNNSFTCGQIVGTSVIGNYTFTSFGAQDVIVEKYDPSGTLLWATQIGGNQADYSRKITYDGMGGVWITGQFSGTMNAGNFTLASAGGTDAFLVKINATNGNVIYAERCGGMGDDAGASIKEDGLGNIFLSGTFSGNFSYGNVVLNGQGGIDVFLVKVDNNGTPMWGSSIVGASTETMWSMTSDILGNTYIAGFSTSPTIYFSGTPVNYNSYTHYVAKFDNLGNYVWSTTAQGNGEVYSICADALGNVYFTGNFDGQATFGPLTLTAAGNDDILLVKINSSGTFAWANSYGGTGNDQGYGIDCNPQGDIFLVGSFQGSFTFGNTPLSSGSFAKSYLAKIDSAGAVGWVLQSNGGASSHFSKGVVVNNSGDVYFTGSGSGVFSMGGILDSLTGSYVVEVADNANIIQGTVFNDINNDGILNIGENGIPNVILELDNSSYVTASNNLGAYQMYTNTGSHSVSIPNIPLYHTLSTPPILTSNFSGMGSTDAAKHFGLYPTPNINDLRIDITPISSPKAGHVLTYFITYTNVGTTTLNATVALQSDPTINYLYAAPSPSSQVGQTLTWNISSLAPQVSGTIHAQFNIPTNLTIGDLIIADVNITPVANDFAPLDNTQTITNTVVGPYDPNYKEVSVDTLYNISVADWLTYTIHFQNIGTDTAFNVVVIDTLSQYLGLTSFEIITSKHQPLDFNIRDGNVAEFRFNNIMLPDSISDPIGSQGFVKYRVKYLNTLPVNSTVENFADIYFDYNAAIRTNTTSTYHAHTTSIKNNQIEENQVLIYPNPTSHQLTIVSNQSPSKIIVTDITGKTLKTLTSNLNQISVADLPSGIYFIRLITGEKTITQKFVKR